MALLHASTVLARLPEGILSHLAHLPKLYTDNTILFALSANVEASELSNLVSRLTSLSSDSVGCLSAPLNGLDSSAKAKGLISCSIATFDRKCARTFRSSIPGRPAAQVGRLHAFRKIEEADTTSGIIEDEHVNWEEVWNRSVGNNTLPLELQNLSPDAVSSVLYFSDDAPEGISNALAVYPFATKLGVIASSTPFVTGRPVTLFKNDKIYSSGAVGVALTGPEPNLRSVYPGLLPITKCMTVTRSEGNLLLEIDKSNPTQLLLAAIRSHNITLKQKGNAQAALRDDEQFYVGVFNGDELSQIHRICSGDPSRGPIALDSPVAPNADKQIQFFFLSKDDTSSVKSTQKALLTQSRARSITFLNTLIPSPSWDESKPSFQRWEDEDVLRGFWAAGENGFTMSRRGRFGTTDHDGVWSDKTGGEENTWNCMIPGAVTILEWMG